MYIHGAVCFAAVSSFDIEHGLKLNAVGAITKCKGLGEAELPLISCGLPSSLKFWKVRILLNCIFTC